ncbi:uncharacterized protein LOC116840872 isoform X2 [Odontomachus brunneus]|uniref:uncharacterized protein LOC116840872 isoform X2 n=1 Tax=Odontomachus brunneus TaxID=486640 RepID=UPI0013F18E54|nr:uncharacterized protein LOC116840872 isoform X2 [Odontomachus brunneus]
MNSRRRRADDFTDSLRSFRETIDTEDIQPVSEIYSEDSLDTGLVRNDALILPNHLINEQHVSSSDTYFTAEENCDTPHNNAQFESTFLTEKTSYMSIKLDFNKCINLFHNKHLKDEEENTSIETAAKTNSCERVESTVPSVEELSSESFVTSAKKNDRLFMEDHEHDSTNGGNTLEDIDFHELKTLLHSLESQQKPLREAPVQERTLRRMSTLFYVSPNDFTERLLTIIEESVIMNESDMQEFPDVSLCRLTEELRKMCKFIDNETAPEWPASPVISTSICAEGDGQNRQNRLDSSGRSLGNFPSPSKGITTPSATSRHINGKSPRKIFRRTPKTISAALSNIQSPLYDSTNMHDSTTTFESLEAYCKRLFPDEFRSSPLQKNRLQSPLQNMSGILHTCDAQMKSLEDSPNVCGPSRNIVTSTSDDTVPPTRILRHIILTPDKREKTLAVERASISPRQRAGRNVRPEMIEPDDLERTLMYEIAKKRQRCLDTAKVIMEIDGDSESLAAQGTRLSNVNEMRLSTEKDVKLMETLMSCKKYKEYLEEHKPLLNLLKRSESYKSRSTQSKKDVHTKKKSNVATLAVPKTPRRKNSRSPSPKTLVVSKPKLFITPGKSPVINACKEKRTYFPNLVANPHKQEKLQKDSKKVLNISPSTQSICRRMGLNYDSVISPVGMYIKGTNPHLIKNLRPKTDEMLLTPRRKERMQSTSTKAEMKFRLSPKRPKKVNSYLHTSTR